MYTYQFYESQVKQRNHTLVSEHKQVVLGVNFVTRGSYSSGKIMRNTKLNLRVKHRGIMAPKLKYFGL